MGSSSRPASPTWPRSRSGAAYERLEAGEAAVSLQDAVAAMRLAWQIERDEAIPARDKALAELAEAQQRC